MPALMHPSSLRDRRYMSCITLAGTAAHLNGLKSRQDAGALRTSLHSICGRARNGI